MSSSSSDELFRFKPQAAAVFLDSPRPAADAVEPRPARRAEQPQSKRARTLAIVADDEEEDPRIVADVVEHAAEPAPSDAAVDDSAWLLPPPASTRVAVVLSEEEQLLLRRNQQTLEELQRPIYEEPEAPASRPQPSVPAPPAPAAKKLVIFLRDAAGDKQKFIIKSDTKFEAVFDAYCTARTLSHDSVRFLFDGDAVAPSATPASLDMDDEDCIDVKRLK